MKNCFILFILVFPILGCDGEKLSLSQTVAQYYQGFNDSDFKLIASVVHDSISLVEGDYPTSFSRNGFHEHFKWDSIFEPSYKLVHMEELDSDIIATVSSYSKRYEFLRNNPLTCRHKFSFEADKISNIEVLDCLDTDWALWERERDALVLWTKAHHPELDGFMHDLTMEGAIDYLKAIELYEKWECGR